MAIQSTALTIAGSDSGAGAGIQADLKTFAAHGVYGCSVLTMVTAQSTRAVDAVEILPPPWITRQLATVLADFDIGALKTGALGNSSVIRTIAEALQPHAELPLVIDPVMISKHGHRLLADDAVNALRESLFPLARVVTPNLHEAAALLSREPITGRREMLSAAEQLGKMGCRAVVLKGGHSAGDPADLLWDSGTAVWIEGERVDTPHTHGTGCTFSAAITANLLKRLPLEDAVREAKAYVTGALRHVQLVGHGINPVNHFWRSNPEFGAIKPA